MLVISLAMQFLGNMLRKYFTNKTSKGLTGAFVMNAIPGMITLIVLFFWGGVSQISWFTLLLGLSFGLVTTLQTVAMLQAIQIGSMAYTTLIATFGMIIPSLSGALFFHEKIAIAHIVGIVLMLISFLCTIGKSSEKNKVSVKWLVYSLLSFLGTGAIGVMQKIHQSSAYKAELNEFLVVAFAVSFLIACVLTVIYSKKEHVSLLPQAGRKKLYYVLLIVLVLTGVSLVVNHKLNLVLSGVMDSAVFFPIVNGGGLVLTTLGSVLLFKEKLTKKQCAGIVVGIVSVVFLCNPFA